MATRRVYFLAAILLEPCLLDTLSSIGRQVRYSHRFWNTDLISIGLWGKSLLVKPEEFAICILRFKNIVDSCYVRPWGRRKGYWIRGRYPVRPG